MIHAAIVWFPLGAATIIFTIAVWVLARAPKSPPIRAFAGFAIVQALLAFIEWGYRHAVALSEAQAWVDAGALWPLVPATMYTLTVEIAAMGRRRPHFLVRNIMFLPAAVFLVLGFVSPAMQRTATPAPWGHEYTLITSPLMIVALSWALLVGLIILAVSLVTLRRGDIRARRLSRAFLSGVAVVVVVNLVQSAIFLVTEPELPFMSTVAVVLLSVVVGNAMLRHGLWELAPQVSATTVLTTMQDGVVLVDDSDMIRYINPAAIRLLRLPSSLIGRPASEAIPQYALEADEERGERERTIRLRDGSQVRVSISSASVDSAVGGRVYVFRDVTERELFQERLAHLAYHDTLSGLANRQAFQEELSRICAQPRGSAERGLSDVLMLLDLDRFKEINDAYGHDAGDHVIIEVAARLQLAIRAEDRAFRLGGDEFAVILRHLRSERDAEGIARKIQRDLAEPVEFDTTHMEVGASVGYTVLLSNEGQESALARADAALFEAKRQRGDVRSFAPGELLPTTRRGMIHRAVREAVRNADLVWYFQAIVNEHGQIVGAEALARLFDESGGTISPAEFIPAAEETGIIHEVGRLARNAAVTLLERMGHPDDFYVTVNVSPLEIKRPELADGILQFMREADAFRSLHLEITETEVLELGPAGHRRLEEMVRAGAQFYIDDFGSGYSSLSRLRNLPVSTVKVDRSFLLNWEDQSNARALVQGTVRLIDGLGLRVVAEGVETEEQVQILREAGCTRFQGYYYHHPVPMEEFLRLAAPARSG